eukprot:GILK01000206.1.p1 GENE.GILK01000206.1~~GILK01000206.1.p1  ORF type:complete len:223 (-),score=42.06 GILK01000206.1:103-735(-)
MATYKLTYFNGRGLAELARLVFAAAGVEFEDNRIEQDKWPAVKAELPLPFKQVPILETKGQVLAQSNTIAKYLAREFNLYPTENLQIAREEMILDGLADANTAFMRSRYEEDSARKQTFLDKALNEVVPRILTGLEGLLEANNGGNGFFVGDSLTLADLALQVFIYNNFVTENRMDSLQSVAPKLKALYERVVEVPNVKRWLAMRPQTPW